ncbi:E3 ubiquitin protein ligase DRIP2-like [Camellia sinensis]|uniref:E3 ubiquitin protein ligase DRIP2-like n=1 Tax=Camellia sinensis TaxID=4442 RepID=UPI0010355AB4|nr:E3 ubiquitin protein ligase DRIP2-like [Camellia sinensis]
MSLHEEEKRMWRLQNRLFTGAGAGAGVKESQDFKTEVLERGVPAKREITFETELFGSKTFLIYVEPVFSNAGDTIGVNYMGMDVTDQARPQLARCKNQYLPFQKKKGEGTRSCSFCYIICEKERSLSSLVVCTPRVSTQTAMTGRRSKAIARKASSVRSSSFPTEKPVKKEEDSVEDHPEGLSSPETLTKLTQNIRGNNASKTNAGNHVS